MDLIDAMGEGLTGQTAGNVPSDNWTIARLVETLAVVAGSGSAAARVLGVAPVTFNRWRKGTQRPTRLPKDAMVSGLRALLAEKYAAGQLHRIRTGAAGIVITGWITVSTDTRERTIRPGRFIPKVKIRNVVNAWLLGQDERAERLLRNAINRHYMEDDEDMELDDVTRIRFEPL